MKKLIIKLIAKVLLLAAVVVLFIGGASVENDMAFAARMFIVGVCMAMPDVVIWGLDGFYLRDKEGNKNDRDHGRIEG